MAKIINIIAGLVLIALGIVLFLIWWYDFIYVVRGVLPALLIFSGLIALAAGISELKDTLQYRTKK